MVELEDALTMVGIKLPAFKIRILLQEMAPKIKNEQIAFQDFCEVTRMCKFCKEKLCPFVLPKYAQRQVACMYDFSCIYSTVLLEYNVYKR